MFLLWRRICYRTRSICPMCSKPDTEILQCTIYSPGSQVRRWEDKSQSASQKWGGWGLHGISTMILGMGRGYWRKGERWGNQCSDQVCLGYRLQCVQSWGAQLDLRVEFSAPDPGGPFLGPCAGPVGPSLGLVIPVALATSHRAGADTTCLWNSWATRSWEGVQLKRGKREE